MNSVTALANRVRWRAQALATRALGRRPTEAILRRRFAGVHGYELDLDHPASFNEKVFARMILTDRAADSSLTPLVDKYLAREHIARLVGDQYVVPLYWHGRHAHEIPFDDLPRPCVLKANHNSGSVRILDGSQDRAAVIKEARKWLRDSYYWESREYQYHPIRRLLLAEKYLDDGMPGGPLDYRCFTFRGEVAVIQVDDHAHSINPFYDPDWRPLGFHSRTEFREIELPRPERLTEMLEVASALGADHDFVRVDLYHVPGHVYVGELTFTPVGGKMLFDPPEWDARLGALWPRPTLVG